MVRSQRKVRSRFLMAGASVAALLGGTVAMASPANADTYTQLGNGYFGPIYGYGSLCLDIRYGLFADYQPVQEYWCNQTAAQGWAVYSIPESPNPGYSSIVVSATLSDPGSEMCLDVRGAGTTAGTTVDIYACNSTPAQVWVPQVGGALYNPNSGMCLDDPAFATNGHTQLQIWPCNGGANQVWLGQG